MTRSDFTRSLKIMDAILMPFGPDQRRYSIERGECGETTYGPWRIYFEMTPIPDRRFDWHFYHEDYDGPGDNRQGSCASFADALNECDEIEDEDTPSPPSQES